MSMNANVEMTDVNANAKNANMPAPSPSVSSSSPPSSPEPEDIDASSSSKPQYTASGQRKCRFNDCDNPAVDGTSKCAFHKNRRQCCVANCTNQVYARKLCVRHGGKKQCQAENCEAHARGGGYCLQHGGFVVKRFCIVEGCNKQAHARQKCVRHGGGRRCKVDGCMQHARAGGLCNRHSHGHQCRIEGCKKTAQHSGSICFRHAMELRAHGEQVPELNISKGGRLSSKKRQQLAREQQLKQEEFHRHQLQQQQQQQQQMQQQMQQPTAPATNGNGNANAANAGANPNAPAPGPFGLPLKINVPNNMPKFSTGLKTPLGGFPTPRSHEFSLLMGLPSPQIDHSQLPSVLAMANQQQQRQIFESSAAAALPNGLLNGPPSVSRNGPRTPSFLTLGATPHGAHGVEEDLDAIINGYKFMGGASPIAYTPQMQQQFAGGTTPILESLGMNMFDPTTGHPMPSPAGLGIRTPHLGTTPSNANGSNANGNSASNTPHFQRLITPTNGGFEGFGATPRLDGSHDYTAQFFADNQANAADKARAGVKVAPTSTPKAGVAAA